jgi:arginine decarboxylase
MHAPAQTDPLRIAVVAGVGRGATLLSSFDDALHQCGTANFNIIPLSSVIPPRSEVIVQGRYEAPPGSFGHRLYVVRAEARSADPGQAIGAGLGWYQWDDGRGVIVEHEEIGASRAAVEAALDRQIRETMRDLCAVRAVQFDDRNLHRRLSTADVGDRPTTTLVLAVFRSEDWS